jgi:hypothetical protein
MCTIIVLRSGVFDMLGVPDDEQYAYLNLEGVQSCTGQWDREMKNRIGIKIEHFYAKSGFKKHNLCINTTFGE